MTVVTRTNGHFDNELPPRRKTGGHVVGVYRSTALQPHERLLIQSRYIPGVNHTNRGNTIELAKEFHVSVTTILRTARSRKNKWSERTNRPVDWDMRVAALLENIRGIPIERVTLIEAAAELIIPAAIEYGKWLERNEPTES